MQQLDLIAQNTRRMARLNQTLLLLVKIENDQFAGASGLTEAFIEEKGTAGWKIFFLKNNWYYKLTLRRSVLTSIPFSPKRW